MENNLEQVFDHLRSKGKKLTKIRKAIVKMFIPGHNLMTAMQTMKELKNSGIVVNKTTVYRELDFLVRNNILIEVNLHPGVVHYESALQPHHHHITCNSCGDIKDIETKELSSSMKKLESKVAGEGFEISDHSLEFYGLCVNCK